MAETIAHRELRNRSSEILRAVRAGESFEITNYGEVVAVLVPPNGPRASSLHTRAASRQGGFSKLPRHQLGHAVQETLYELRGDR